MNYHDENQQKELPIKRILILADFASATGFANVAQNIVKELLKDQTVTYQIDVVGINYHGLPNEWQNIYPRVRVFPATLISGGDLFGRSGYLSLLSSGAYDYTWILQDTFNIEPIAQKIREIRNDLIANGKKSFKYIYYFPIDAKPKENWIRDVVSLADVPVVYTQYGYKECLEIDPELVNRLKVIPHGTDISVFHPIEDKEAVTKFRHDYFMGRTDNKFLVINVNRNQPRKDIARTLQIFKLFKQQCPDSVLYLHMKHNDVAYDLNEVARQYQLIPDEDYIVPKDFNEHDGVSFEMMNYIYNSADAVMTTTLGEGWGLSITEAMATKTPIIAPDNTSITEILADGRGILVPSGKSITDWIILSGDNERVRPLVSVADFVDKLVKLKQNYKSDDVNNAVEKAYKYITEELNWDKVGQQWRDLFISSAFKPSAKLGRNDICPVCKIKIKKCQHGR